MASGLGKSSSKDIYGSIGKKGGGQGQYWAPSNVDEDERQPGLRDKKYEGYSNLKGSMDPNKKSLKSDKNMDEEYGHKRGKGNLNNAGLEEEYILNLQKQIVLMEHEIKLLKDREVDQKNKASGYETLLRDGIPLNEHFLALKNKYNNEKDELDKYVKSLEDEIKREELSNKNKRHKIEILKREYDEISSDFQAKKDATQKQIKDLEAKLYNERHTKTIIEQERIVTNKKLQDLKTQNLQMSRVIQRNKMFNKKGDEKKAQKEEQDQLKQRINELNKEIETNDIELDKEKRKLDDKNLLKKQKDVTRYLEQDNRKITNDISIASSRIKDLESLKQNTMEQIRDILTEKRKIDKDNQDLEQKIQGKGVSEQEAKQKQFDAEREQLKKIQNSLNFQKQNAGILMERLKVEESNGSAMLEEKNKLESDLTMLNETLAEDKALQQKNKMEIISLQIRKSQLKTLEAKLDEELKKVQEENQEYVKKNDEFEKKNEQLNEEITRTIQKIDVNSLLKEIDIEDMMLLSQNNTNMNFALTSLIDKWEQINKLEKK